MFETVGLFNTDFRIVADKDWLLRSVIAKQLPILYIGIPVCYFLAGGISCQYRNEYFFEDSWIIQQYRDNPTDKTINTFEFKNGNTTIVNNPIS